MSIPRFRLLAVNLVCQKGNGQVLHGGLIAGFQGRVWQDLGRRRMSRVWQNSEGMVYSTPRLAGDPPAPLRSLS